MDAKKPTYIATATSTTSSAPKYPNWARLWIIWGTPSRGPWAECSAMNSAPTALPRTMAIRLRQKLRPKTAGASAPVTKVSGMMLELNQIVNRSRGFPCRSSSGMMSMVRRSSAPGSVLDLGLKRLPPSFGARGWTTARGSRRLRR